MRAVVQRVLSAEVRVEERIVGTVGKGLLVYAGVESGDARADLDYIADKLCHIRIFPDAAGKMNLSVRDVSGRILLISNFTLLADARKGRRPEFTQAASGEPAKALFDELAEAIRKAGIPVATGIFGAAMSIASVADGPVNILLDSRRRF